MYFLFILYLVIITIYGLLQIFVIQGLCRVPPSLMIRDEISGGHFYTGTTTFTNKNRDIYLTLNIRGLTSLVP